MNQRDRDDLEALFAARAAAPAPAPPPFAAVLARVHDRARQERSIARRRAGWLSLAAAAAVIVGIGAARRAPSAPEATAEPPPSFACSDDPRAIAQEAAAYATDRAVAGAEDEYAACLVATPRFAPASAAAACGVLVETDVTCGAPGPLPDEVLDPRTRGGSLE